MKVALIGIGQWGKVLGGELSKLAEVKYKCDSKTDLGPVLADPEISTVFIATPTETHFTIASLALKAGKHVFLEKPGTGNAWDLEKLMALAEEKKVKLAIGYELPHHPAIQKLKGLIKGKPLKFMRLEYQKWGPFKDDIVTNLLCHDASILKYLDIPILSPTAYKTGFVTDLDILATRFAPHVMSIINRVSPVKQRTLLAKLENESYLWSDEGLFEIVKGERKKIVLAEITSVEAELTDFLSAIEEDREPLMNGNFALEVWRIIEGI